MDARVPIRPPVVPGRSSGRSSTLRTGWFAVVLSAVLPCALPTLPRDMLRASETEPGPLPLEAAVTAEVTHLRAGPGDDFYPTERLVAGAMVEVWAVDPGGWCAVRPVEGSFSWVRAADVDETLAADGVVRPGSGPAPRVGVVVADGAVARVGSQLNDLRHVAQVRLEAGERVEVLGEQRVPEGRHAGLWLRIAPPAGEFRWADMGALESSPRLRLAALAAGAGPRVEPPAEERPDAAAAVEAFRSAGEAIALAANAATAPPPPPPPQPLGAVPQARRILAGWLPLGTGVFETAPPVAVAAPPASMADELADIDLALSLAVAGPPDGWNLPALRERLRLAAARTTSNPDRLRADAIDARIARFEAIQAKQQALAAGPPPEPPLRLGGMWSSLGGVGTRPIRPGVLPGGAPADGKPTWPPPDVSETTGRLATVVSRRPDAPRWALVDGNNNVIVFVNPQPGVNLAPMVGQQVSVRGARGYMPEYKRPYLVATEARPRVAAAPQPLQGDLTR